MYVCVHLTSKWRIAIIQSGDSATRGLFCGITRIISGSEIYDPCQNAECPAVNNNIAEAVTVIFFDVK